MVSKSKTREGTDSSCFISLMKWCSLVQCLLDHHRHGGHLILEGSPKQKALTVLWTLGTHGGQGERARNGKVLSTESEWRKVYSSLSPSLPHGTISRGSRRGTWWSPQGKRPRREAPWGLSGKAFIIACGQTWNITQVFSAGAGLLHKHIPTAGTINQWLTSVLMRKWCSTFPFWKKTTKDQEIVTVFNCSIFIKNKKCKTKQRYSKNKSQRIQ